MLNGGLHRHQQELGNTDQPLVTQTSLPIKDTLNSPQQHTTWSLSNCSLSRHHGHPSLPSPLPSVFSKESSCRLSLPSSFLCCSCRRHFVKSPPQSLSTTGCVLYVCVVCVCTCVCVCALKTNVEMAAAGDVPYAAVVAPDAATSRDSGRTPPPPPPVGWQRHSAGGKTVAPLPPAAAAATARRRWRRWHCRERDGVVVVVGARRRGGG